MHHAFKLGDDVHNVELSRSATAYRLHLNDQVLDIDLKTGADGRAPAQDGSAWGRGRAWLTLGEHHVEVVIATRGDDVFVHLDGEAYQLRYQHPLDRLAAASGGSAEDNIRAPMPGSIVSVSVQAGDAVTKGQTLLVMESMKMETTIAAPRDGVIAAITYEKGQTFDRDALLVSLEPNK